jgi:N-acyl-D-aspartate/D-glutamate deacylase
VPSRQATRDELRELALAMAASGRGVLEITPETFPLAADECAFLQDVARTTGRPVSFSAILDLPERDGVWAPVLAQLREGRDSGALVVAQISCRPMRFDFDLVTGCASLDAVPEWRRFRDAATRDARVALLRDRDFRAAVRAATIERAESPSSRRWQAVVLEETSDAADRALVGSTLGDIGARRGGDPIDVLFDAALADLDARFSMLLLNYDDARVAPLLRDPDGLIALSDAGAHVSVLCDAGYATYFLGHWVRERRLCDWTEAVRRLTSMPADLYGLADRGRLVPGAIADVTCFDPQRVASRAPEKIADFPAGASRWVVGADGVPLVLVAGVPLLEDGALTGARAGRVLGVGDQRSSSAS